MQLYVHYLAGTPNADSFVRLTSNFPFKIFASGFHQDGFFYPSEPCLITEPRCYLPGGAAAIPYSPPLTHFDCIVSFSGCCDWFGVITESALPPVIAVLLPEKSLSEVFPR